MEAFLHQAYTVTKVALARLRFIIVFVVAALAVGYWDNFKNYADKWTRPAQAPDSLAAANASLIEFYCTMHPNVVRNETGSCPICGMPLTKRRKGEAQRLPADVLARVQLTPQRVALANVQTSLVEYRELMFDVRTLGVLDYDETRLTRLSARVAGRADQLFVTYIGAPVKQGDPLYSLYSPEVYTALREYLLARKRLEALPSDVPSDSRADATTVTDAALQRLLLWGVTEKQLDELAVNYVQEGTIPSHIIIASPISGTVVAKNLYEGGYVQVGESVYTVADLSKMWLQAKLYERDVPIVNVGDPAIVTLEAMPNESFTGKITFKAIQLDAETRTLDARIEVDNLELKLHPGMFATADVKVPVAKTMPLASRRKASISPVDVAGARVLAVPRSAVIDTGRNKIVYVESAQGVYDMHAVQVGLPAGDFYPVLGGLGEGQAVVTVGGFLVDAENRLNPSRMAGPEMDDHAGPHSPHDQHDSAPGAGEIGRMKM